MPHQHCGRHFLPAEGDNRIAGSFNDGKAVSRWATNRAMAAVECDGNILFALFAGFIFTILMIFMAPRYLRDAKNWPWDTLGIILLHFNNFNDFYLPSPFRTLQTSWNSELCRDDEWLNVWQRNCWNHMKSFAQQDWRCFATFLRLWMKHCMVQTQRHRLIRLQVERKAMQE